MRKIFIFWIIFLIILAAGISLVLCSKLVLRREERKAEKLKKSVISRPSRVPKMPTAGDEKDIGVVPPPALPSKMPAAEDEKDIGVTPPPELPSSADLPALQDIPVQINTDSLEIDILAPQAEQPAAEEQ